jgi:hypothetical protein
MIGSLNQTRMLRADQRPAVLSTGNAGMEGVEVNRPA